MQKSILIVDDSAPIRRLVRSYLELQGLEVHEAGSGRAAIANAPQLNPDAIVLDFSMPEMNGLETAAALRLRLPHTPIILFTAHKDVLLKSELMTPQVTAVLSKTEGIEPLFREIELLTSPK